MVYDSVGRQGGISSLRVVQASDDTSCLSASAVTSSSTPGGTSTSKGGPTSGSSDKATSHSSSHVAVIAGAAAGGLVVLVLIILLVFFCRRKNSREPDHNRSQQMDLTYEPTGAPPPEGASYLLPGHYTSTPIASEHNYSAYTTQNAPLVTPYMNQIHHTHQPYEHYAGASSAMPGHNPEQSYQPQHSTFTASSSAPPRQSMSQYQNEERPTSMEQSVMSGYGSRPMSTSDGQSTMPVHGNTQPPQVIMHTDIEDTMQSPVELPPQYSENRVPIPGFAVSEAGGSSSTSTLGRDSGRKGRKS